MKGLLKKEWFVLMQKPLTNIFLPVLLFSVMALATKSTFTLLYFPIYAAILPISLLITDENSRWDRFALGMPYSRKSIVSAKYVMTLLLIGAGSIISMILMFLVAKATLGQAILISAGAAACGMLLNSLLLPLNLKFGTAKARLFLGVLFAAFGCFTAAALSNAAEGNTVFTPFETFASWNIGPALSALMLLAAGLLLTILSWAISVWIYRRKQF